MFQKEFPVEIGIHKLKKSKFTPINDQSLFDKEWGSELKNY